MKNEHGIKNPSYQLSADGMEGVANAYWNLTPEELVEHSIKKGFGKMTALGAIAIETGKFTGRSPKDRFIVKDELTADTVDWNDINMPFEADKFDQLLGKIKNYLKGKDVYVRDLAACADRKHRLNLRLFSEYPWSSQFANNMFLRLDKEAIENFTPEWTLFNAPGFLANPDVDDTRQENFAIINFSKKMVIVGGTGYTGEIKKGVFSVLNYILPHQRDVLSMHCSANVGEEGDTAIFFGLSGTGKTTLSADPNRSLIGDDEHGWSDDGVFNFEGGCYAKTIDLTEESEPEIYNAIKHGAILENIGYFPDTRMPDFTDSTITENTRVSYPIDHISNAVIPSRAGHPKNIFFLTCDAFGVLPPISRLTPGQAMYHFISGYTAKVAGTEEGITEPTATFSACFGAPFMPLHPTKYAEMLGKKMQEHDVRIWLVNTGWTGGAHGTGSRMKLRYTRAMIHAALDGELDKVEYKKQEIFGLSMPTSCPNVPDDLLDPKNTWSDKDAFDKKAQILARKFNDNFEKFEDKANEEIMAAAPKTTEHIS